MIYFYHICNQSYIIYSIACVLTSTYMPLLGLLLPHLSNNLTNGILGTLCKWNCIELSECNALLHMYVSIDIDTLLPEFYDYDRL